MKLVLAKLAHGFDDPLAISIKESENELSKLLLHGISVSVPVQELLKMFPDYLTVKMLPVLRVRGKKYSTFAVLKDSKEADEAYEKINGKEEKDSYGKPQKLVTIELGGGTTNFYVRKMITEGQSEQSTSSRKRSVEEVADSKRLKSCNSVQCDHGKEVEQLKKELRQKDEEIFNLQKILSALTRKHGL